MTPRVTGIEAHLPARGLGASRTGEVEELQRAAFTIAYRMLGSVTDAEDIAQEALLRYHRAAGKETIDSPIAFLTTVTARLVIDVLRSARARRETYVGTRFPERLLTDHAPGADEQTETADSLWLAFLVLLESLSPVERAVFLLHDVFDYGYDETAHIVDKSEENCRQLAARARRHAEDKRPRFETSRQQHERFAAAFFAACKAGEMQGLIGLLSHDVVLYGNGGGKAPGARLPQAGLGSFMPGKGGAAVTHRRRIASKRASGPRRKDEAELAKDPPHPVSRPPIHLHRCAGRQGRARPSGRPVPDARADATPDLEDSS